MNILILNWRDPKNPLAGGAEKLNREILNPFLDKGDTVIWYATQYKGLSATEEYQQIKIIRSGNILSHFFLWPLFLYTGKFGKIDTIIDCVHGIGYLSNIFAPWIRKKVLVCEVARNIWDEMLPFPANVIGKCIEPIMFRLYSNSRFWTISQSTQNDLIKMGIPQKNIHILPMGFDAPDTILKAKKSEYPKALFVGRLAHMKGIKDAIEAIYLVNQTSGKKWKFTIIGRGTSEYEKELRSLVKQLKLEKDITFLGYVSEKDKFKEMSKAWVLLVPSSREGWGMIVGEANHVGTQVIGYRSPGLVDSLVYYSKDNLLVNQQPEDISNSLTTIQRPKLAHFALKPGWEKLHKEVIKDISF